MRRSPLKVALLAAAVVIFNVAGNALLSVGMRSFGGGLRPLDYLRALTNPWVAGGVLLLVCWLITQLSLLSWADLSFVLPITSSSYILTVVVGVVYLHEQVSLTRWAGSLLIVAGVAVVGRTRPRTGPA